jgi:DNA-binding response OmpR family regulator
MKALVVEDAPEVIETIVLCLTIRWPDIVMVATGSGVEAIALAQGLEPDIILLDLELDDLYGLQVLKEIRSFSSSPVIIITANHEETSRLKSIEMGTDDYLVKPFTHIDLLGSVTATLGYNLPTERRHEVDRNHNRGLVVDFTGRRVWRNGVEISLTTLEWKLLATLIHGHGAIISFSQLGEAGWGTQNVPRSTIQMCIRGLGAKLGDFPQKPSLIHYHKDEGHCLILFN